MFDKLIDLLVQWLKLFQFFYTVAEYERTVVLRCGKYNRLATPGRIRWKLPFNIETTKTVSIWLDSMMIGPQSLTTRDDQSIVLTSVLAFRVTDPKAYLVDVCGPHVLQNAAGGAVGNLVLGKTWSELHAMGTDLTDALRTEFEKIAAGCGTEVCDVRIADMTRSRSIRLLQAR